MTRFHILKIINFKPVIYSVFTNYKWLSPSPKAKLFGEGRDKGELLVELVGVRLKIIICTTNYLNLLKSGAGVYRLIYTSNLLALPFIIKLGLILSK